MKRFAFLAAAAGALTLGGCASYPVQVMAIRDTAVAAQAPTYYLQLEPSASMSGSRLTQEAIGCLRTAMAHRGYGEVPQRDHATVVVSVSYEVTPAGHALRQTSQSRQVSRPLPPMSGSTGRVEPAVPMTHVSVSTRAESQYRVLVRIEARDAKTNRSAWRVEAISHIGAADKHAILPVMIAAAEPHLDPKQNTHVEVAMGQSSAEVRALRKGT